jgi:hypothetical protein
MSNLEVRKSGGGKLSRSETVTVRLDPKLRYLAELAARKQRRTLSSYIEWSIEEGLGLTCLGTNEHCTLTEDATFLWDVDEADRFAKLAFRYPDLLTHEEQVLWKLIRECPGLWVGQFKGRPAEWTWVVEEKALIVGKLRDQWKALCSVGRGEAPRTSLEGWLTSKQKSEVGFVDMEDDIPF